MSLYLLFSDTLSTFVRTQYYVAIIVHTITISPPSFFSPPLSSFLFIFLPLFRGICRIKFNGDDVYFFFFSLPMNAADSLSLLHTYNHMHSMQTLKMKRCHDFFLLLILLLIYVGECICMRNCDCIMFRTHS